MARVRVNSRLRYTELHTLDGFEFWGLCEYPQVPEQPDDIQYIVVMGDCLDALAYRYYGAEAYKWVIAVANGMEIEPTDLNQGETIRIPSPRYVLQTLAKKRAVF